MGPECVLNNFPSSAQLSNEKDDGCVRKLFPRIRVNRTLIMIDLAAAVFVELLVHCKWLVLARRFHQFDEASRRSDNTETSVGQCRR